MNQLDELKRLAEAATKGPWEDIHPNADDGDIRVQVYHVHKRTVCHDADAVAWKLKEQDARFIAAANPTAILSLITAYERLQQRYDEAIRHLKFTTHAAEYVYQPKKDLMPGWDPTFYHTLTYEGDLDLINRTKAAREFLSKDGADE